MIPFVSCCEKDRKIYIFIYHRSSYVMKRTEGQCEADTRRYREDQESTVKRVILQVKVKKPSNHEKTRSKISSSTEEHDNFNLLRSFDSARRVSMISTKKNYHEAACKFLQTSQHELGPISAISTTFQTE